MLDGLEILIYLDDILVKSISSISDEGYIEIKGNRKIWDVSIAQRKRDLSRSSRALEDRKNKDKREGYKGYAESTLDGENVGVESERGFENRGLIRVEEDIRKIYTEYIYHKNTLNVLSGKGVIKSTSDINKICESEFVEFRGELLENSIDAYIDNILFLIKALGINFIDDNLKNSSFTAMQIKNLLEGLKERMCCDNIFDLVVRQGDYLSIVQVNNIFFKSRNGCRGLIAGCRVNVIGKVIRCPKECEGIHLLRRVQSYEFYENILREIDRCIRKIEICGIEIPKLPNLNMGNCIQILPISIYI